jgi:hypothetical protein
MPSKPHRVAGWLSRHFCQKLCQNACFLHSFATSLWRAAAGRTPSTSPSRVGEQYSTVCGSLCCCLCPMSPSLAPYASKVCINSRMCIGDPFWAARLPAAHCKEPLQGGHLQHCQWAILERARLPDIGTLREACVTQNGFCAQLEAFNGLLFGSLLFLQLACTAWHALHRVTGSTLPYWVGLY